MDKHVLFLVHLADGLGDRGPFEVCWDIEDSGDGGSPRIDIGDGDGVILGADTPEHIGARFRATAVDVHGQYTGEVVCETV